MTRLFFIIPSFNSGQFLFEAIASLQLQEWNMPVETVVVIDGSTDKEELRFAQNILATMAGFTLLTQKNKGVASARNLALKFLIDRELSKKD